MINIKDISKYALQISFRNETRFVNNAHIHYSCGYIRAIQLKCKVDQHIRVL